MGQLSALVYGDIDLNLIDGSAIWVQSTVQALARAGCAVTLMVKSPVRTDRLIAPLLAEPGVTVRRPHAEHLISGLGSCGLPVPALPDRGTAVVPGGKRPRSMRPVRADATCRASSGRLAGAPRAHRR
jgi:hypothetical protein